VFSGFKNAGSAFLEGVGNRPPLSQQSTTGATGPSVPGPQGNFLEDIFNTVGKASPALAVSAIGELFAPKPDRVDVSGVTDELRNRISGDALSPLDIKALEQQFQALNPGANVANNSAFLAEKARIEESSRERRAAVRDEISFTFEREQLQRRLQATQIALNLDSAQTAQLIQIAQADLEAIGINLGLDAQDARDFKSLFSQFGQLLVQDRNFSGNQTV
jgi:hypothetical protein